MQICESCGWSRPNTRRIRCPHCGATLARYRTVFQGAQEMLPDVPTVERAYTTRMPVPVHWEIDFSYVPSYWAYPDGFGGRKRRRGR